MTPDDKRTTAQSPPDSAKGTILVGLDGNAVGIPSTPISVSNATEASALSDISSAVLYGQLLIELQKQSRLLVLILQQLNGFYVEEGLSQLS